MTSATPQTQQLTAARRSATPEGPKEFLRYLHFGGPLHHFFHEKLVYFLAGTGFEVRWIRREQVHPVWKVGLRRGDVPRNLEAFCAKLAIRTCLRKQGVRIPKREIDISVRGQVVEASFIWNQGQAGSIDFYKGGEKRQIGNWLGY